MVGSGGLECRACGGCSAHAAAQQEPKRVRFAISPPASGANAGCGVPAIVRRVQGRKWRCHHPIARVTIAGNGTAKNLHNCNKLKKCALGLRPTTSRRCLQPQNVRQRAKPIRNSLFLLRQRRLQSTFHILISSHHGPYRGVVRAGDACCNAAGGEVRAAARGECWPVFNALIDLMKHFGGLAALRGSGRAPPPRRDAPAFACRGSLQRCGKNPGALAF